MVIQKEFPVLSEKVNIRESFLEKVVLEGPIKLIRLPNAEQMCKVRGMIISI